MILLLFPVLVIPALLGAIRDAIKDHEHNKPRTVKPTYVMQSSKPRPSHRSSPRKRDADFYRDRRVKKAVRKLPF